MLNHHGASGFLFLSSKKMIFSFLGFVSELEAKRMRMLKALKSEKGPDVGLGSGPAAGIGDGGDPLEDGKERKKDSSGRRRRERQREKEERRERRRKRMKQKKQKSKDKNEVRRGEKNPLHSIYQDRTEGQF